nr:MAG TPA: hypothetical protein [Caudoviricetes sp.]
MTPPRRERIIPLPLLATAVNPLWTLKSAHRAASPFIHK